MMVPPALHNVIAGLVRNLARTWLITLIVMLVCAAFAARTVAAFGDVDRPVPSVVHTRPTPVAVVRPIAIDASVLVDRNIFCSSCTRTEGPGPAAGYTGEPAILIATSLGRDTSATVRVIASDVQGSWGLDEKIPGVGRITQIAPGSIEVTDDAGHTKRLALFEAPQAAGHSTGAATPSAGPAAEAASEGPFAGRIKKLAEGSYEVDRDVVRELVASAGSGAGVRAVPILEKGEIKGLRFFSVKPTSIAGSVGMKNGDVLSAIDGEPIKTANQLLELYGKLDKLSGVELQGTRGGKPLAIALKFR